MDEDCEYTELSCEDVERGAEAIYLASFVKNEDGSFSQRVVYCNT